MEWHTQKITGANNLESFLDLLAVQGVPQKNIEIRHSNKKLNEHEEVTVKYLYFKKLFF